LPRAGLRHRFWGTCIGLGATAAVLIAYLAGVIERPELHALDMLFRYANVLRPSDTIVHIDITDAALEQVHKWPWPRRLHAELVRLLDELGSRSIVFDIVFAEPDPPRVELPQLSAGYDLGLAIPSRGQVTAEDAIYDDDELAAAIRQAGSVYLPLYFRVDPPQRSELRETVAEQLRRDFSLETTALAGRLDREPAELDRLLAGVKRQVAGELVAGIMLQRPQATAQDVLRQVLGPLAERSGPNRDDVLRAYSREQAIGLLMAHSGPEAQANTDLPAAWDLTPPLAKLVGAARGAGYVIFEPDVDGVVRRLPLVASYRGKLLKQLGLAVACDLLGVDDEQISVGQDHIELRGSSGKPMIIRLDRNGQFLINWASRTANWNRTFRHIPVSRVMEVYANRQAINQNNKQLLFSLAEMVELFTPAAYTDYEVVVRRRDRLAASGAGADQGASPGKQTDWADVSARIAVIEDKAKYVLEQYYQAAQLEPAGDEQDRKLFEAANRLYPLLVEGRLAERIDRANARLAGQVRHRLAELRPMIEGKVCLIGYTASAVADFKPTPLFKSTPGVMVHSNIINDLLQGGLISPARRTVDSLVIVACGCLVILITMQSGPRLSLLFVVFLLTSIAAITSVGLFGRLHIQVSPVSPSLAVLLSWSLITMYRQLTEERTKRQVATVLGQYTAPVIARQIVQDPARHDLSPVQREVTSFFSDLAGFTGIAERLGPERTRALLNPYLGAMSDVLHSHSALINKFYGDGIFAFFNPPILPTPDHAHRACLAAVDSLGALQQLKIRHSSHRLAEQFAQLYMRIGLTTGTVYVGDFGSVNKLDYTCLGDTVNLASRLESANKVFGTQLMIAEGTREQAGDGFEYRYLADLQVKGKTQSVTVYELLGLKGRVDSARLDYARKFAEGVELFKIAKWDDCMRHFKSLLEAQPDDLAVLHYLDTCRQFAQSGPPADWTGQLQLDEK